MNQILTKKVNLASTKGTAPDIRAGYTLRVHQKIKEGGKERIQIFEGLVIKLNSGYGVDKTFTVRKIVSGVGVEKIFPLHSANIAKIEIVKKAKVRRAKLFYMRDLTGKSARLRETYSKENDEIEIDKSALIAAENEAKAKAEADKAAAEEAKAAEKAAAEAKKAEEAAAKEAEAAKEEEVKAEPEAPVAEEKESEEEVAEEPTKEEEAAASEAEVEAKEEPKEEA